MKKSDDPTSTKDLVLPAVGTEIRTSTKLLNPITGSKFYIATNDYAKDKWGPWTMTIADTYSEKFVAPGLQVTTSLPMEGMHHPYFELRLRLRTEVHSWYQTPYATACIRTDTTNGNATSSDPGTHLDTQDRERPCWENPIQGARFHSIGPKNRATCLN